MSPARQEAFHILLKVNRERAYASSLLTSPLLDQLSRRDRGLSYELVLGVLRWQHQLDYFVQRYANRSIQELDGVVLTALRLGLYQIRFLDRVPDWAAVSESVELVKKAGLMRAAALVNAVLRRACRQRGDLPAVDVQDEWDRVSIEFSHPRWLVEKWVGQFGRRETIALMEANNTSPRAGLRINRLRGPLSLIRSNLDEEGIKISPSKYVPEAYAITRGTLSSASRLVREGQVYLQDEGSQLVAQVLDVNPGSSVLELCAAPGGKTSQLAGAMNNSGFIVACDLHGHRLRLLHRTCRCLGVTIAHPVAANGTRPLPLLPTYRFERVMVDAPCSGTGTLRRHPEIKWRLRPEAVQALAHLQLSLLRSAAPYVASGGRLVYSTCSIEPEENHAVVDSFLECHPSFTLVKPLVNRDLLDRMGFIQTLPHRHQMDGFFAAVFSSE